MKILITSICKIVDANLYTIRMNKDYDKIIFCHSGKEKYNEIAKNLEKFEFSFVEVMVIDYYSVEQIFKKYQHEECVLQLNGYSSIEMYLQPMAYKYQVPMIYFDIKRNEIIEIATNKKYQAPYNEVRLEESLSLFGATVRKGNFSNVEIDGEDARQLCEIAMDFIEQWKEMIKVITYNQSIKTLSTKVTTHLLPAKLIRKLEQLQFILMNKSIMTFKNHTVAYLMTHEGAFLELFVYHYLKKSASFDEVYPSVVIEWNKELSVLNEIDLVARKKDSYYFISCKSRNIITKDFIYEIVLMSKNFSVEKCIPILVSGAKESTSERLEYYDGILILLQDLQSRNFVDKILNNKID